MRCVTGKPSFVRTLLVLGLAVLAPGCSQPAEYTLYMSDAEQGRRHVATFDASAEEIENRSDCHAVGEILAEHNENRFRYWCEKGHYRP